MTPEINNNLEKIKTLCQAMHVKALYLVGSAARNSDYNKNSDLDFLYSMIVDAEGLPVGKYDYFDMLWKLEEITGKKVDLIPEPGIRNKFFKQSLLEDRVKIYEA